MVDIVMVDFDEICCMLNYGVVGDVFVVVVFGMLYFLLVEFCMFDMLFDVFDGKLVCDFYVNMSCFILWELE